MATAHGSSKTMITMVHGVESDLRVLENFVPPADFTLDPPIDPVLLLPESIRPPGAFDRDFGGAGVPDVDSNDPVDSALAGSTPNPEHLPTGPGPALGPEPVGGKSGELRRLYAEHRSRPLEDVLRELRHHLVSQQPGEVDRSKLLFGMLWVRDNCRRNPQKNVARDVVHSEYKNACAVGRVPELNAANFGKCVSTLFPKISVRRLGPRGASRYHYSEIELIHGAAASSTRGPSVARSARASSTRGASTTPDDPAQPRPGAPTATPSAPSPALVHSAGDGAPHPSKTPARTVFVELDLPPEQLVDPDNVVHCPLFIQSEFETPPDQDSIVLPESRPFLPSNARQADVDNLVSLHHAHCHRLVVMFRGMLMGRFYRAIAQYPKKLPEAARQLLAEEELAPWLENAEQKMYQHMALFLPRLIFMELESALGNFRELGARLVPTVKSTYSSHPRHVQLAMLRPARVFEEIVLRFVRVYELVRPVVTIFSSPENRGRMHRDWVAAFDRRWLVQNALPSCGHVEVLRILEGEMEQLLDPDQQDPSSCETGTQGILLRWASLLKALPSRFPAASTAQLVSHVKLVGTTALQHMTAKGAESFTHWWTTKMWFDELADFFAEVGGFVRHGHCNGRPVDARNMRVDRPPTAACRSGGNSSGDRRLNSVCCPRGHLVPRGNTPSPACGHHPMKSVQRTDAVLTPAGAHGELGPGARTASIETPFQPLEGGGHEDSGLGLDESMVVGERDPQQIGREADYL